MPPDIPPGDFEVILYHTDEILFLFQTCQISLTIIPKSEVRNPKNPASCFALAVTNLKPSVLRFLLGSARSRSDEH
jgi:hypothetical protein